MVSTNSRWSSAPYFDRLHYFLSVQLDVISMSMSAVYFLGCTVTFFATECFSLIQVPNLAQLNFTLTLTLTLTSFNLASRLKSICTFYHRVLFNPLHATGFFLYPRCSDVFREYRNGAGFLMFSRNVERNQCHEMGYSAFVKLLFFTSYSFIM